VGAAARPPQRKEERRRHGRSHEPARDRQRLPDASETGEIHLRHSGAVRPHREALEPAAEQQGGEPVAHLMGQRREQEKGPGEDLAIGQQVERQRDGCARQEHRAGR